MISVEIDTSDVIVYVVFSKWELSVDDGFVVVNVFFYVSYWFLLWLLLLKCDTIVHGFYGCCFWWMWL